ncbi:MAG: hypothetical protein AB1730_15030 [Myxococcota bacterium]|jgi:hypothetical protein
MTKRLTLAAAAAALVLSSCGPENGLGGSLGAVFPLDISRVEIAVNQEAMQVTYYLNRGVFLDVVARVSVSLRDVEMRPGVVIPLGGMTGQDAGIVLDDGGVVSEDGGVLPEPVQRCTVAHAPGGEPVRMLPPVVRGDMVIRAGGQPGELTKGDFSVLFSNEGGDLGQGRTLYGSFSAVASDAGFGELP